MDALLPCAVTEQLKHCATLDMTVLVQIWRHVLESVEQLLNTVTSVVQVLWHWAGISPGSMIDPCLAFIKLDKA